MSAFACHGCGVVIVKTHRGRNPKWCSERCRKLQYARRCVDCGATCNTDGRVAEPAIRCLACAKKQQATLEFRLRRSTALHGTQGYTTDELIGWLDAAADALGTPFSKLDYDAFAKDRRGPTGQTIIHRFGTWVAALDRAGIPNFGASGAKYYLMTERQARDAIAACMADSGRPSLPTIHEYEAWSSGRPEVPSASGMRFRWRTGWPGLLVMLGFSDESVAA